MSSSPFRNADGSMVRTEPEPHTCQILTLPLVFRPEWKGMVIDRGKHGKFKEQMKTQPPHVQAAAAVAGVFSPERLCLRVASRLILTKLFQEDRLRHSVACAVAAGLNSSFISHECADPPGQALTAFKERLREASEAELLWYFDGWNKAEEYHYRTVLEDRARNALLVRDPETDEPLFQIVGFDPLPEEPPPSSREEEFQKGRLIYQSEWDAVRVWCHHLYFLMK